MWILDVDTVKWAEVTPPESMTPRYSHSITATSLGPGLTEVLVFGGKWEWWGDAIARTTILRFELTGPSASVAGPSAGKWALVDVAHNDTRGSAQQLSEKRIRQATARASSVSETSDHSSQDRVRALEQQLRAAEQREHDTQRHHQLQLQEKDHELTEANRRHGDAERQLRESQQIFQEELAEANRRLRDTEERVQLAEQREQATQNRSEQLLQEKDRIMAIKERESYEANHRRVDTERRVQELIAENETKGQRGEPSWQRSEQRVWRLSGWSIARKSQ
ncbi:myosin heavy chain, muscle-like [Halichondria panicea]|uniref:myosin heavy chain, muscle-like n=1 Tax=Halichondria panicea TaxID=6063 RepID=UPI00312B2F92